MYGKSPEQKEIFTRHFEAMFFDRMSNNDFFALPFETAYKFEY